MTSDPIFRLRSHVRPPDWQNPTPKPIYDLVVIGGGTAGLVSAAGGAGLGARVALVEKHLLGGDCLNTGCVPSKTLLRSARAVAEARSTPGGVSAEAHVDGAAAMERMRAVRADIAPHDSARRLAGLGVDVFFGTAVFDGPRSVAVDGRVLRFKRAILATGSRPSEPPIPGLVHTPYFTSDTIFDLAEPPRDLIVIGAGAIGCELAHAFALLGSRVQLLDAAARVLSHEDPDASAIVARRLAGQGVALHLGAPLSGVSRDGDRTVASTSTGRVAGDAVLVATGRTPNVAGLGLQAAGVEATAQGLVVNDRLQTSNRRIYAAGDVCSWFNLTHAADAMARVALQNALFVGRKRASTLVIPWCTYTRPEVAHVGVAAGEIQALGLGTITVPLDRVDRSVIDDETDGFVRIHHQRGRIRAATIVAPHAGELIGLVAHVMQRRGTLGDLGATVFPYPTVAMAFRQAADAYRRNALTPGVRRALRYYFTVFR